MPLFYFEELNAHTKLAIWEITEPAAFFQSFVPTPSNIKHPHKRLQHLAGRYLLQYLFPDFPIAAIQIADTRKPFLENEQYHFSISHCGNFAAAIVSTTYRIGIDIEMENEKIERIAAKFLHTHEKQIVDTLMNDPSNQSIASNGNSLTLLTMLWCAKEAIYKWWGKGSVDFKEMIRLYPTSLQQKGAFEAAFHHKNITHPLCIQYQIFPKICLAWVLHSGTNPIHTHQQHHLLQH